MDLKFLFANAKITKLLKIFGIKTIFVLKILISQTDMDEILKQIRADLRRSMNGIASKSMREKGLHYKLNFGVDIPRLRELSKKYPDNAQLAELLWKQETRELKILATMLYPVEKFDEEKAERWVREIPTHEIREQICMNLFQKSAFADKMGAMWIADSDDNIRATGYWLYARLALSQPEIKQKVDENAVVEKAIGDLCSDSYFMRNAARNALTFAGRNSKELSQKILLDIQDFKTSDDAIKNEIYDSLSFEFE